MIRVYEMSRDFEWKVWLCDACRDLWKGPDGAPGSNGGGWQQRGEDKDPPHELSPCYSCYWREKEREAAEVEALCTYSPKPVQLAPSPVPAEVRRNIPANVQTRTRSRASRKRAD